MRQISINQTSISDPIRFPKDPLVSIDRRAKGIMKFIYSESKDRLLLSFSDYSGKSVAQRIFNDMPAFKIYLSTREDVNTWEVRIKAKDDSLQSKLAYFHREPFGDIEQFGFERDLNRILSLEGGGRWITEYVGCSATDLKRVGMIDQSTWWQTIFTTFNTETSFQKANQTHEQEYASWRRTLGWGMLSLLLGGMITPFFINRPSAQDHEKEDVETGAREEFFTNPERSETQIPQSFLHISQATIPFMSSMMQKAGTLALSYRLSWQLKDRMSISASAALGIFSMFMNFMPGSLARSFTLGNSSFIELLEAKFDILDVGKNILALPNSDILVLGRRNVNFDYVITLIRLASNGTLLKANNIGLEDGNFFGSPDAVVTIDGNVVVGFSNYLLKLNYEGKLLWAYYFPEFDSPVLATTPDNSIIAATTNSLLKFSNEGALSWAFQTSVKFDSIQAVTPSINGSIAITGSIRTESGSRIVVAKFANNGIPLWIYRLDTIGQPDLSSDGYGLVSTNDGSIFVTGNTMSLPVGNNALVLAKLDKEGNLLWNKVLSGSDVYIDGYDIAITSPAGNLLIGGVTNNIGNDFYFLLTAWTSNGELMWSNSIVTTFGEVSTLNRINVIADNDSFLIGGASSKVDGAKILVKLNATNSSHCSYVERSFRGTIFSGLMNSTALSYKVKPLKLNGTDVSSKINYSNASVAVNQQCSSSVKSRQITGIVTPKKLSKIAEMPHFFSDSDNVRTRNSQSEAQTIQSKSKMSMQI